MKRPALIILSGRKRCRKPLAIKGRRAICIANTTLESVGRVIAVELVAREQRRLEALESYDVLDTPREHDFDDIAALASRICGTPIAVVNLIGEGRQFFKAEVGLGVRETPLDSSFCARTILEDDFLMIPDATKDPRFDCNPLVVGEPHIRFYAGAILKTAEKLPIGTVCVLGYEPKELDDLQQETLRVLARQVMVQLELRKAIADKEREVDFQRRLAERRLARANAIENMTAKLRSEDERSRKAQAAGRIGTFELDNASDTMTISEEVCRIFGLPVRENYPASIFEALVLEEDAALKSDAAARRNGSARLDVDYRITRKSDGELRWVSRRARFVTDDAGMITRMVGVMFDTTDAKRKDQKTALLLTLGDRLREAGSVAEITRVATDILASGIVCGRTGYSTVDLRAAAFSVEAEQISTDITSIAGRHSLAGFPETFKRLKTGETIVIPDVNVDWLASDRVGYEAIGVRSLIAVPVLQSGALVGVLFAEDAMPRDWTQGELDFISGVADRTYAAIAKANAEEEQAVLNQELSHRMKNTLAMVQAIAGQTLRDVADRSAVAAFGARLQALGAAHEVLLKQSWSSAKMREVIDKVLALHADGRRISIDGPDLSLGPKAGLSLSLLLHELATNAIKYGALSNDLGKVAVRWSIDDGEDDPLLCMTWTESGGPTVSEPTRRGFGSRLIRMGLAGTGDAVKSYLTSGLTATFKAPLSLIQEVGI